MTICHNSFDRITSIGKLSGNTLVQVVNVLEANLVARMEIARASMKLLAICMNGNGVHECYVKLEKRMLQCSWWSL